MPGPPMYPLEPGGPLRTGPPPPRWERPLLPREVYPGLGPVAVEEVKQFLRENDLLDAVERKIKQAEEAGEKKGVKAAVFALISASIQKVKEVPISNPKLFALNFPLGYAVTDLPFGTLGQNDEGPVVYIPLSEYDRQSQQRYSLSLIDALRLWTADP